VLEEIVAEGPRVMSTAIGKVMTDPDTGKVVRDASQVISAIKELRLNESYMAALVKQLDPPDESEEIGAAMAYLEELVTSKQALEARVAAYELDQAAEAEVVTDAAVADAKAVWQAVNGHGKR
jgi:hypothetical protein